MNLTDRAQQLRRAIARAVQEHGAPNTFSFAELHQLGGPPPMIAGRVARLIGIALTKNGRVNVEPLRCEACDEVYVHHPECHER